MSAHVLLNTRDARRALRFCILLPLVLTCALLAACAIADEHEDPPAPVTQPFQGTPAQPSTGGSSPPATIPTTCNLQGCCSSHGGITSDCRGGKVVCIDGFLSGCDCCPAS